MALYKYLVTINNTSFTIFLQEDKSSFIHWVTRFFSSHFSIYPDHLYILEYVKTIYKPLEPFSYIEDEFDFKMRITNY